MTTSTEQTISPAKASASTLLVRDTHSDLEVLLVQKNPNINFGGSWVFPGGMVEDADQFDDDKNSLQSAQQAACRETFEETSIRLDRLKLLPIAKWVTPEMLEKRYSTWFFIYDANRLNQKAVIDKQEIVDSKWLTPKDALQRHANSEMTLNGTSFVSLLSLISFTKTSDVMRHYQNSKPHIYLPRAFKTADGVVTLFQEDCGYHLNGEHALNARGTKHRTFMYKDKPWEYIFSDHKA